MQERQIIKQINLLIKNGSLAWLSIRKIGMVLIETK